MMLKTIYEVALNKTYGTSYYNKVFAPKIIQNGKSWKNKWQNKLNNRNNNWKNRSNKNWNNKSACLILSYDIDETSDIKKLPKLLKLLKKYDIKAGFAVIGHLAEQHPEIFRKVLKEGHELINHTQTHPNCPEFNPDKHFHKINPEDRFQEIKKCHDTVKRLFNYEMKGFRVPHFGFQYTKDIYPMLKKLGYAYSSSTVAIRTKTAGFPYRSRETSNIWELPLICCPKHPYCIFDTSHAFRSKLSRHNPADYIATFESLIDFGIEHGMFINIYQDPQDIYKFDYEATLKIIQDRRKELWITTYEHLLSHLQRDGNA